MIPIKRAHQIAKMRKAGALVAETLRGVAERVAPGVSTLELDVFAEDFIRRRGGEPLFKGYRGFPNTLCVSVNEEVVHGIPGDRQVRAGDIVSVDVGVRMDGWCGDAAATFAVGEVSDEARRLMKVAEGSLELAIRMARPDLRLSVVCRAIQEYVESQGFSVVKQFTGHGIGREMHEEPQVPNFVAPRMDDPVLRPGMTLAIEPMVNAGGSDVQVRRNGWTVVTRDGSLSAHYEHTVALTERGAEVLTR